MVSHENEGKISAEKLHNDRSFERVADQQTRLFLEELYPKIAERDFLSIPDACDAITDLFKDFPNTSFESAYIMQQNLRSRKMINWHVGTDEEYRRVIKYDREEFMALMLYAREVKLKTEGGGGGGKIDKKSAIHSLHEKLGEDTLASQIRYPLENPEYQPTVITDRLFPKVKIKDKGWEETEDTPEPVRVREAIHKPQQNQYLEQGVTPDIIASAEKWNKEFIEEAKKSISRDPLSLVPARDFDLQIARLIVIVYGESTKTYPNVDRVMDELSGPVLLRALKATEAILDKYPKANLAQIYNALKKRKEKESELEQDQDY